MRNKKVQLFGGLIAAACLLVGIYYISFLVVSPSENSVKVRKKSEENKNMCEDPKRVAGEYIDFAKADNSAEAHRRFRMRPQVDSSKSSDEKVPDYYLSNEEIVYRSIRTYQLFDIELKSQQCDGKQAILKYSAKSKNYPDDVFNVIADVFSPDDSEQWYVSRVRVSPELSLIP